MPVRRQFLLSVAAVLSAGCTARSPGQSTPRGTATGSTRPTRSRTATHTSSPTLDCTEATTVDPPKAAGSNDVTPPPYPALPDSFDADSVGSFVADYETAYVVNRLVLNNPSAMYVDVAVSDSPPVTEGDYGYVVDLDYTYAVEAETPADYPPRHVAYLVREGVVARAELDSDEGPVPFPMADATVFRCES